MHRTVSHSTRLLADTCVCSQVSCVHAGVPVSPSRTCRASSHHRRSMKLGYSDRNLTFEEMYAEADEQLFNRLIYDKNHVGLLHRPRPDLAGRRPGAPPLLIWPCALPQTFAKQRPLLLKNRKTNVSLRFICTHLVYEI